MSECSEIEVKYPQVEVPLSEIDGNAFSILGYTKKAMRNAGLSKDIFSEYEKEATSDDYDHLLQTTMEWVTTA